MHRVSTAYSKYFNEKHSLSGSLFEGPFRAKQVNTDDQLIQLFRYIHLNPLTAGLTNRDNLINYPWSSLPIYLDNKKNLFVAKEYLQRFFQNLNDIKSFTLASFEKQDIDIIKEIAHDDEYDWNYN